ncbi:Protein of unknown function [Pedococcus dokdonensis]|uniref:DUF3626 domain-containing protein n=1 Tax=Pedococcus dokdonensis TaxID=443156 RepID=A0A1H0TWR3_9MICO|nr:DUF3626 domain-containing protein [Pedococcus dokdonensis]SDP58175.1 Protein of unknown function [Pedococcus dokdonensis]
MRDLSTWAREAVDHVSSRVSGPPIDPTLRVTLNFHPDRGHGGLPILEALLRDGCYRSQFETGTSNGGLTAHPGGNRWVWEQRIFGGAYDVAPAGERPKYGALNHRRSPVGGAPRFGSAHLRLAAHTVARTTFCYPDSVFEPEHFGTAEHLDLAAAADEDLASGAKEPLDSYVEAQVHGVVDLATDVEALVLDPVFRDTEVAVAAQALPCPVEWHDGFRLDLATVRSHPDYRGPHIVEVADEVAAQLGIHQLDPAVIGAAVATGRWDPQDLKKVWHHLARFGQRG